MWRRNLPVRRSATVWTMRYSILIAGVLLATPSEVLAQKDQIFEHLDELGRMNEKLQERNLRLERENKELRDRLRQYEALDAPAPPPPPAPAARSISPPGAEPDAPKPAPFRAPTLALPQWLLRSPSPTPPPPSPEPAPAPEAELISPPSISPPGGEPDAPKPAPSRAPTLALPQWLLASPSATTVTGVLAIESIPKGAEVSTSLGSGCKTPCELEITTDQPFSITLARSGYETTTVDVQISNAQLTPNPISVLLRPAAQKRPRAQAPGKPLSVRP